MFVPVAVTVIAATVTFAPATTAGAKNTRHGRDDITKIVSTNCAKLYRFDVPAE